MQWDSWGQLLFSKMMNWELNNDEELEQEFSKQKQEQVQKPKKEMNMVCLRKRKKAVVRWITGDEGLSGRTL